MSKKNYRFKSIKIKLLQRKEAWVLTLQGWLSLLLLLISLSLFLITNIHPFLAMNVPIKADALVIEGWLPDYAVEAAINEFRSGAYQKVITTGGPLQVGYYLARYKNFAELSAATLAALGVDRNQIVAVPAPYVARGRTDVSAAEVGRWIAASNLEIHSVNLYSFGTHSRRSWLVFKRVLAPKIKLGVIAAKPLTYNPQRWWRSSEGTRLVMSETIAYLYTRFFD